MRRVALALGVALAACSAGPPQPAVLDTKNEACQWCRMTVSDARFAAQIVAPGEEPRFFDDAGCLAGYLKAHPPAARAVAYVADHRTKAWVRATDAVYTRAAGLETPMASHVLAHADAASRDLDPAAAAGAAVASAELFGAAASRAGPQP